MVFFTSIIDSLSYVKRLKTEKKALEEACDKLNEARELLMKSYKASVAENKLLRQENASAKQCLLELEHLKKHLDNLAENLIRVA